MLVLWPCPNFVTWHSGLEQTLQKKAPAATGSYIPVLLTHHVLLHLLNTIGTIITGFEHPVFPLYFLHPWLLIRNVILELKRLKNPKKIDFPIYISGKWYSKYTYLWKRDKFIYLILNLKEKRVELLEKIVSVISPVKLLGTQQISKSFVLYILELGLGSKDNPG